MTVPDIPIPDEFAPTHRRSDREEVQLLGTVGTFRSVARNSKGSTFLVDNSLLSPLPPPLPKLRDGWYVIDKNDDLGRTAYTDAERTWDYVDRYGEDFVGVVFLEAATMRLWHVDRDGNRIEAE